MQCYYNTPRKVREKCIIGRFTGNFGGLICYNEGVSQRILILPCLWIVTFKRKEFGWWIYGKKGTHFMKKTLALILCGALMLSIAGCGTTAAPAVNSGSDTQATTETTTAAVADNSDDKFVSAYPAFMVTSESLDGTKWVKACAHTDLVDGENASPQLSWEPVEGATVYVIYMVDISASNNIHWKSAYATETNLPQGWASSDDYFGPRPPEGATNQYNVYVFALKAPVERVKGSVRLPAIKFQEFVDTLDTDAEGNTGNIVAVGRVIGKCTGNYPAD